MKIIILCISYFLSLHVVHAQLFVSSGGFFNYQVGDTLYVGGDILFGPGGYINNDGIIIVEGDWINNSGTPGHVGNGTVIFVGSNPIIGGNTESNFGTLKFDDPTEATLENNIHISNTLVLNNTMLTTNDHTVHVQNTDLSAITWENGFVNTNNLGSGLIRTMSKLGEYYYPVGSENISMTYRAVMMSLQEADTNIYAVRFAHVDPTFDYGMSIQGLIGGFDITNKDPSIKTICSDYYFNISKIEQRSAVDINLLIQDIDGEYDELVYYNSNGGKWETTPSVWDYNYSGPSSLSNPNQRVQSQLENNVSDIYALAQKNQLDLDVPNGFSPNGDGVNEFFEVIGLDDYPQNTLSIYNRWGDLVYTATPYMNDWYGQSPDAKVKFSGHEVVEGTYFFILELGNDKEPIRGSVELRKD